MKKILRIERDEHPENPRTVWDNMGTMLCRHKHYNLGDKQLPSHKHRIDPKLVISLSLYLYDHSGITISTEPFSCSWDSGQVGWIYVSKEAIRKEWGVKRISKKLRLKIESILRQEVTTYDEFLRGEVYSYSLIEKSTCDSCQHEHETDLDSCHGFYGSDHESNGLYDQAGYENQNYEVEEL